MTIEGAEILVKKISSPQKPSRAFFILVDTFRLARKMQKRISKR
jgi:hypothetical protein